MYRASVVVLVALNLVQLVAHGAPHCTKTYTVTKANKELAIGPQTSSKRVICLRATADDLQVRLSLKTSHRKEASLCEARKELTILDGCNLTESVMADNICHYTSKTACLSIRLHRRDNGYQRQHFHYEYSIKPEMKQAAPTKLRPSSTAIKPPQDCKTAIVKRPRGVIESPNYPANYTNNFKCDYKIELAEDKQIQLIFREVNLQEEDEEGECHDYIEVRDGFVSWSPVIRKKFCGHGLGIVNEPIISTSNKIMVKFVTDGKYSDKGFQLTYDPYQPTKVSDVTQRVTGVVIGTACGLVFLILTFLAICHSRRLSLLRRRNTRRYEMASTGYPDVIQQEAPPSYIDVMSSPEKYPPTPSGPKRIHRFQESRPLSEGSGEELPPYPGLVIASAPVDNRPENDHTDEITFQAISRSISTDV